ncbi:hypothetical protein MRX96_026678 [Rhipicephalus microplus]
MDASTFYGGARLEDHASKRQKVDDATAEEILMRISNGDISDGDFSDDELEAENEENIPANGQVTASTTTAALPARPDATVSSNAPAASTKAEFKWVKKDFAPSDVDCHYNPEVASTCQQPLVYFSKYFTEQIFEDLAEFTNRYVLQRDGAVLATTKEEIKIFFWNAHADGCSEIPTRQNVLANCNEDSRNSRFDGREAILQNQRRSPHKRR